MAMQSWSMTSWYYGWIVIVSGVCIRAAAAEKCGDTELGVVVAASVLGTLAVVALVLGILLCLLRRRNGGVLFPKPTSPASVEEGKTTNQACYVNPAYAAHDVTEGKGNKRKSSPKKNLSPAKKQLQKTWTSLPGKDDNLGGVGRQGSFASLDTHPTETVTESVWLHSQDIIGLGFNISGNMRDGIYVSQLHNRGPASESGKIHIGDRILSVTIAYDNIVYEDALTILSYASPYPVNLTLQKHRTTSTPGHTASTEQLNHPMYRSQSLDALQRIHNDPLVPSPKRTYSEMKLDTHLKAQHSQKLRPLSQSYSGDASKARVDVSSDVLIHRQGDTVDGGALHQDTSEIISSLRHQSTESAPAGAKRDDIETLVERKKSRLDTEAAREFASLMDQVQEGPSRKTGDSSDILSKTSPRTPPNKPERKKKPSNSSIVSLEYSAEAVADAMTLNQTDGSDDGFVERPPSPNIFVTIDLSDSEQDVQSRGVQAGPPSNSSKGRDKTKERESRDKTKKKDSKPKLDENELERLIAMNSFAPGTQGLAGIQAGGKQGGVLDDFVPRDIALQNIAIQSLSARTRKNSSSSEASSQSYVRQKGGVAFEVRDDMLTGRPMSVDISHSRNSSASPSRSGSRDRIPRASSLQGKQSVSKKPAPKGKENREDGLDWSGKRLVRSGSFSQIPQDDSLGDWMDKNKMRDDDNSSTSGRPSTADTNPDSDPEMDSAPRPLASRDVFKARENLASMSDLSNSMSSSRSSSPPVTNGPTDSLTLTSSVNVTPLVNTSPSSVSAGLKNNNIDIVPTSDSNGNSKTGTVTLKASANEDVDC